ncbi:SKA complex subunit 1 [Chanos chanos]|uniref:SKA complex subunit 1 n=1 Tax=Chanos chanos TaxID=29144 RepID=A0A6J2V175_CHACN|nr:spindle and kinetochore-associated protein 1 [Chanos chanos]
MSHCELEDLTRHVNDKIAAIKTVLELRAVAKDPDKRSILRKIGQDVCAINGLLDRFEKCVKEQRDLLKHLKELDEFFKEDVQNAQHLKENTPLHMPRGGQVTDENKQPEVHSAPQEQEPPKKSQRNQIKEMEFITVQEFESIPQYMKGRLRYDQLNAAVQTINKAVVGKYKILHQPLKNLTNVTRKLHQRFKDEETEDTKGQFFVVDADIQEFGQVKVDKRFVNMLNMLRHCQRLRETRGGRLTRYVLV